MQPVITVIGTTFVDCKGFAHGMYRPLARNLGSIEFVNGGVGRNVAENLSGLGMSVFFVSSVDHSAVGKDVMDKLRQRGVDTSFVKQTEGRGMGMWLAILDAEGNLSGSISQMPDLTHIQEILMSKGAEIARQSTHIALELDLNVEISWQALELGRLNQLPVYGLPGNLEIVLKHRELLSRLECFICNHIEAERLWEPAFGSLGFEQMKNRIVQYAEQEGLPSLVITLGEQGSIYYDKRSGQCGHQPAEKVKLVDSSGAGDAFFSGAVAGLTRGMPLSEAVGWGTKVAAWTIESPENTCASLSEHMRVWA